jgi:hypothetical protein
VFINLKKTELLLKTAIDTCIKKLLSKLNLTTNYLRKSFTLRGLRKTKKNLAKEVSFSKQELDVIRY